MATTTRKGTVNPAARPRAIALAVATAFLPWYLPQTTYAQAPDPNTLPTGGQITNGAGQIHAPQGTHLQIDQYTQKMIAEFGSFSIGANARVNLSQPGASSIALFRDVGGDPSKIFGNLTANGQLFISNQNGVLFGASARVDVGALFATSLSITDHDFMAGRYHWYNEGNAGNVVNQGQIVTANGYTALVGPQVRNDGIIIARAGSVALAAGDRVSLDMIGDGLISVSVDQSAYNASVINTGSITADGGTVLLTARSANALLDTVINNSGTIRANSLVERNGQIVLDGGTAGVVGVTGTLEARGMEAGTKGGTIHVLGENVGIFGNAVVDASGYAGGGEIRVGGGWQGGEGLSEAQNTFLGRDATLRADALHNGDGGSIVMWAQGSTRAHGTISVKGGAEDGDGGRVETSGLNGLEVTRAPNLSAPKGKAGLWLLDPHNLTVVDTAVNSTYDEDPAGTFTSSADGADIADDVIEAALNNGGTGGTTVVLATGSGGAEAGTIDVQASIDFNGAASSTLVMRAHDDIILTAGVTAVGSGLNLQLFANDNTNVGGALAGSTRSADAVSGNGDVLVTALLSLNGGSFQSSGRNFSNTAGITTGGGNVTINHLGDVSIAAAINAGGGTVDIDFGQANGGSTFTLTAALTGGTKTVTGGTGNDVFDLDGAPTTTATLDGGVGSDRVELTGDTDFALSDTSLTTISGHNLTLADIEVANLTGGAADNSFTVSGWSGSGTLDGAGGTGDSIVAVNDVATIDLTDTSLARAGLGALTLANIEVADLTGGVGVNAFTVSSWTGSATLTGDANNDSYTVTFTGAGSGSVTVVDTAGTDTITVNGTAGVDAFTLTDSAVTLGTETVNYPSADIETLAVNGLGSDDTFTVSSLTRAATIDGGAGTGDTIVATNDVDFALTNASLARSGGQATLTLANIEVATLTGGAADNSFTVSGWSGSGTLDGAGGTSDSIVATNDLDFTLTNTSLARTTLGTLTLADIESATLTGGAADNSFTVSGWSGAGTLDGAGGAADSIVATNDVDFTLTNASLARSGGQATLTLANIEVGTLTGGAADNSFTVSGWSGTGTMDGAGGAGDSIVATNDVDFTLTNTSLARTTLGTLTLASIESATLSGGAADNGFTVSGWSGSGTVDGAGGTGDSIVATNDVDFTLTNTSLARTTLGTLTLVNLESATLTGGAADNSFTVSGWSGSGTLDGAGGTGDSIVATNDVDFTLTDTSLARSGGQVTLTLANVEVATLTGGAANNSFTVSGWSGTGTLDGAGGTGDSIVAVNDVATIDLTDTSLARAGLGALTLANIEVADLTGGVGVNAFTVSSWTGSATLTGDANNDSYTVTFTGAGSGSVTVVDTAGTDTITVNGTAGVDAFTLTDTQVARGTEVVNYTNAQIETLAVNGLASDDTFTVSNLTRSATLDGGAGTGDAIVASNDVNFTLTDTSLARSGGQATLTLANMEVATLTGGAADNSFTVSGWSGSGTLDGAGGTGDSIVATNDVDFTLTNTSLARTTLGTLTMANIESATLTGGGSANTFTLSGWTGSASITGGGGTDTLVGPNATNTWTIDGAGDGNINGTVVFVDISHLSGGTTNDTFIFTTGSLAGNIDGGAGANSINIAAVIGANTVNLQTGRIDAGVTVLGGTFANVTSFTGDNIADVLVGTNVNTAWTISGTNDGTLSTGFSFTNIPNLTGGAADDSFVLAGGTLTGTINGGVGNNTVTGDNVANSWTITVPGGGTLTGTGGWSNIQNLIGGTSTDSFTLSGGGTITGTINGGAGSDTLTGDNVANAWTITGPNSGTLTGTGGWSNIENLVGGTSTDSFSGVPGGSVGGTISDGGGGATTLSGTINSAGSQTYSAAVSSAGVTLNAGTAAISATNAGNNFTGTLDVTGSSASITDINALTIDASLTGGLTTNSGALTYVAGMSVGSLTSTASGAVNQSGAITVTGATNINAGGNAITLTSANDFQGTLSLVGGTTQVRDANALTLGNVNVGAFTAITTGALNLGTLNAGSLTATTNGGNITQSGPANVTGATSLQAGSGSIVLPLANDFGGVVAASGIGITLNDVNTLAPGTINAGSGSVNLSANSLGAGGTVSAGSASSFSSNTNVNGLDINMPNVPLALSGAATQWNFTSTPTSIPQPNPVTVPGGNVGVTYNLASIIASVAQQQAASASSSVSATVAAVIVDEANKTFGTDSVAEDVEYGFAGEVGATPPMDHRIDESGISLPRCVEESREGMPCK